LFCFAFFYLVVLFCVKGEMAAVGKDSALSDAASQLDSPRRGQSDIELGSAKDVEYFDNGYATLPISASGSSVSRRPRLQAVSKKLSLPVRGFRPAFERVVLFLRGPDPPATLVINPFFPRTEAWLARICRSRLPQSCGGGGGGDHVQGGFGSSFRRIAAVTVFCVVWLIAFALLTKYSWFDTTIQGSNAANPVQFFTGGSSFWAKNDVCGLGMLFF
jgi:hypothetical protein